MERAAARLFAVLLVAIAAAVPIMVVAAVTFIVATAMPPEMLAGMPAVTAIIVFASVPALVTAAVPIAVITRVPVMSPLFMRLRAAVPAPGQHDRTSQCDQLKHRSALSCVVLLQVPWRS
jgi:hypothetical protein